MSVGLIIWQIVFILLLGLLAIYLPPFIYYKFSTSSDIKRYQALRGGLAGLSSIVFIGYLENHTQLLHTLPFGSIGSLIIYYLAFALPTGFIILKLGKKVDEKYEDLSKAAASE